MDSDLHRIKLDKGTVYQTSKGGNYYFRYQVKGERKCVTSGSTANNIIAMLQATVTTLLQEAGGSLKKYHGSLKVLE